MLPSWNPGVINSYILPGRTGSKKWNGPFRMGISWNYCIMSSRKKVLDFIISIGQMTKANKIFVQCLQKYYS